MQLSPKHLQLIEYLADPTDPRTKEDKCEAVGLSRNRLYQLYKEPDFCTELDKRIRQLLVVVRPMALQTLVKELDGMEGGTRVAAARNLLTVTGDIGSGTNIQVNVGDGFGDRLRTWRAARVEEPLPLTTSKDGNGGNGNNG